MHDMMDTYATNGGFKHTSCKVGGSEEEENLGFVDPTLGMHMSTMASRLSRAGMWMSFHNERKALLNIERRCRTAQPRSTSSKLLA